MTPYSSSSPCFTASDFRALVHDYSIGNRCQERIAHDEFRLVLRTRAECLLRNEDSALHVAEFGWKMDELFSALEIRDKIIMR